MCFFILLYWLGDKPLPTSFVFIIILFTLWISILSEERSGEHGTFCCFSFFRLMLMLMLGFLMAGALPSFAKAL